MNLTNKFIRLLHSLAFFFFFFSAVFWILMTGINPEAISPLTQTFLMIYDTFVIFIIRVLELFPFLFLGTFTSAIMAVLVSEEDLIKLMPKNITIGLLIFACLGFFFPGGAIACIPISARLLKKGAPLSGVILFLCFSPIINLVVLGKLVQKYGLVSPNVLLTIALPFIIIMLPFLILKIFKEMRTKSNFIPNYQLNINQSGFDDLLNNQYKPFVKIISISLLEFIYFGNYLFAGAFFTALLNTFFLTISVGLIKLFGYSGMSTVSSIFFSHHPFIQINFIENSFPGINEVFQVIFFYAGSFFNIPNLFLMIGLSEIVFGKRKNEWEISNKLITLKTSILFSLFGIYLVYGIIGNEFTDFLFPGFTLLVFLSGISFVVFAQIYFRSASIEKSNLGSGRFPISLKDGQSWVTTFLMILIFAVSSNIHLH